MGEESTVIPGRRKAANPESCATSAALRTPTGRAVIASNPYRRRSRHGLLRGACHPAALRADRVARNDGGHLIRISKSERVCSRIFAAQIASELLPSFALEREEGAGKAGCRLAPMVRVQQESTRQNHRYRPINRPSLRNANGLETERREGVAQWRAGNLHQTRKWLTQLQD